MLNNNLKYLPQDNQWTFHVVENIFMVTPHLMSKSCRLRELKIHLLSTDKLKGVIF